ncbi:MAG: 2-C-methyl-D-erythritol 4-phosphate cytidylyltransferase, partial [Lachnospiraceae bacterium]|nr:2-C-methyl-D-erythritol 4-phosphate cytidylyltransferase [Lachnospiraceae bacterium]
IPLRLVGGYLCIRDSDGAVSEKKDRGINKFRGFSAPGENRQLSIFNGLEDIRKYAEESDIVLIHDAARPLLSDRQITDCLKVVAGHDGVLPVLPMKDTVYYSEDGISVSSLLERARIFAGQAPEAFVLGKYYEANKKLLPDRILQINGSTEPAIMAGMDIAMIPGDEGNFKITTKADLERFREKIEDRS